MMPLHSGSTLCNLALQQHLNATGHVVACATRSRDGKLVDFGVMLDAGSPFSKACPTVADCSER